MDDGRASIIDDLPEYLASTPLLLLLLLLLLRGHVGLAGRPRGVFVEMRRCEDDVKVTDGGRVQKGKMTGYHSTVILLQGSNISNPVIFLHAEDYCDMAVVRHHRANISQQL